MDLRNILQDLYFLNSEMKQREAVVDIMEKHNWKIHLSTLRDELLWNHNFISNAKDPFANIRRIVQTTPDYIYKIKPWFYWLLKYRKKFEQQWLFVDTPENRDSLEVQKANHYYYQWLLVEIWNLEKYQTYVPHQDQNKMCFSDKWDCLKDIITAKDLFWSITSIDRAKTIDVIWLNKNWTPSNVFEVEHSTDIINSLNKFWELEWFNTKCIIVADERRHEEFNKKISQNVYENINPLFLSYDNLSKYYEKITEYHNIKNLIWF